MSRLRGHKHLIRGNHDTGFENAGELYRYFETVTDFNDNFIFYEKLDPK